MVDWTWDFAIWVHIAALRPNPFLVNSDYLAHALNSSYCYKQSQILTKGIANKDLGLKRMIKIEFPLPPLPLQTQFADRIRAIEASKARAEAALKEADGLFGATLQEVFG